MTAMKVNDIGIRIHELITDLYPICRSITGDGVRESLRILKQYIPLEIHEIPTGTQVYDWTVPKEWNITDAYIKDPNGNIVIDYKQSNLHIVSYSIPIQKKVPLIELKQHLYSIPEHPDWIPYRTSYYNENWGFCLRQDLLDSLTDGEYEVYIDSRLENGSLTYGEYLIQGESSDEILISCHCCHPSLCNDNLSGMALSTFLANSLAQRPLRFSYRFVFIPATIGSITWLSVNRENVTRIKHGLVVAGVGDPGNLTYKKTRQGNAEIDQIVSYVLSRKADKYNIIDFIPYGYDERQYCSPGINLPVGSLTRTPFDQYPEYHTSADNLEFVQPASLADSFNTYLAVIDILEKNKKYLNTNPMCEPQLGKRGLYRAFGGWKEKNEYEMAMFWILNNSDGSNKLLDISEKSGIEFEIMYLTALELEKHDLLQVCS